MKQILSKIAKKALHNWIGKVVCILFAGLVIFFYNVNLFTSQFYELPLSVKLDQGMWITNQSALFADVNISGNSESLRNVLDIGEIVLEVDLRGSQPQKNITTAVHLAPSSKQYLMQNEFSWYLSTPTVSLSLERYIIKTVPIVLNIDRTAAEGYNILSLESTPNTVRLEGGESTLKEINKITTELVELKDFKESAELMIPLDFSSYRLHKISSQTVTLNIEIEPKIGLVVIRDINPVLVGLPLGAETKEPVPLISAVVRGPLNLLADWDASNLSLYVTLGKSPSRRREVYPVQSIKLPKPFILEGLSPQEVAIELVRE